MTTPDHPDTADVFILNGTACSAGTGPGSATLPWDEARALADAGLACYGTSPPQNMLSSGGPVSPP
jgi:hypothetical protein